MSKRLLSAADIAKLNIPGLPSTREGTQKKAEREGWYSEERIGLGGKRKIYEIPAHYLARLDSQQGEPVDQNARPRVARTPVNHSMAREPMPEIDAKAFIGAEGREEKLRILGAIEVWLYDQRLTLEMEHKLRVVELLHEYAKQNGALDDEQLDTFLRLATL